MMSNSTKPMIVEVPKKDTKKVSGGTAFPPTGNDGLPLPTNPWDPILWGSN